jgi:class 3 adenylate cyclase
VLWSLLAPLGAVVFDRPARAWLWFAAFLGVMVASIVVAPLVRPEAADIPADARSALAALNIAGVSLVAFTLLAVFARQRAEALQRVERLLLNILPDEIAERLKDEPGTLADHFEDVSVLFADVVDFTPLSSRLDPTELVDVLDALFTEFDRLADEHGVEKIKTIGDCYMVAAGRLGAREVEVVLEAPRERRHEAPGAEAERERDGREGEISGRAGRRLGHRAADPRTPFGMTLRPKT